MQNKTALECTRLEGREQSDPRGAQTSRSIRKGASLRWLRTRKHKLQDMRRTCTDRLKLKGPKNEHSKKVDREGPVCWSFHPWVVVVTSAAARDDAGGVP